MLKRVLVLGGFAAALTASSAASAATLTGAVALRNASGDIVVKQGSVDVDAQNLQDIRLRLQGAKDQLAKKVKIVKADTENRIIVLAAFRDVGDLPSGTSIIVKANLLKGNNGSLMYGDVFTRTCDDGVASQFADEDSALERLAQGLRERDGCHMDYRGGMLVSTIQAEEAGGQH